LQFKGSSWKESLAYILSYVEGNEKQALVTELGDELLTKKKDINSAIICMIIAKQVESVIDLWKKRALYMIKKGMPREDAVYLLFEKSILLKTVCNNKQPIQNFDLVMTDMAELLNGEQLKSLGCKFLDIASHQ